MASETQEVLDYYGKELDLYSVLGLPASVKTNPDRVRAAYVKHAYKLYPSNDECPLQLKKFQEVMLAFLVLVDCELRRIFDDLGFEALVRAEQYQEFPVYEQDPYEVYEEFFKGTDPANREWLLLNGTQHISEDEVDVEVVEDEGLKEVPPVPDKEILQKRLEVINKPMPSPPVQAGAAVVCAAPSMKPPSDDVWQKLNET